MSIASSVPRDGRFSLILPVVAMGVLAGAAFGCTHAALTAAAAPATAMHAAATQAVLAARVRLLATTLVASAGNATAAFLPALPAARAALAAAAADLLAQHSSLWEESDGGGPAVADARGKLLFGAGCLRTGGAACYPPTDPFYPRTAFGLDPMVRYYVKAREEAPPGPHVMHSLAALAGKEVRSSRRAQTPSPCFSPALVQMAQLLATEDPAALAAPGEPFRFVWEARAAALAAPWGRAIASERRSSPAAAAAMPHHCPPAADTAAASAPSAASVRRRWGPRTSRTPSRPPRTSFTPRPAAGARAFPPDQPRVLRSPRVHAPSRLSRPFRPPNPGPRRRTRCASRRSPSWRSARSSSSKGSSGRGSTAPSTRARWWPRCAGRRRPPAARFFRLLILHARAYFVACA